MPPKALGLLAALALAWAGCGQDEEKGRPIPRPIAAELEKQLASIQDRFEFGDGACADIAEDNEPAVARLLDQIPSDVDADVRDAARRSFDHLFEIAATQCDEEKNQETTPAETETTPPETTPPETAPTETQDTETTPPETQTEELPPGQQKKRERERGGGQGAPQNENGGGAPAPEGDD